jgi:epsilon-lactone hydrolase
MASTESEIYRKSIVKNNIDLNIPIDIQRANWENFVLTLKLSDNIKITHLDIENIHTEWISTDSFNNTKVILYFHGGGYTAGSCITHRELASRIAITTGRMVVLFNYGLSPENKFPQAIIDSEKIYLWLCQNHTNASNIVFGGDSAGGGLALTTILYLRDKNFLLPSSIFLISPWIDLFCTGESYISRKELDPMVIYEGLIKAAIEYLGETDLETPLISPLSMNLKNLPPMLIQVGDHEILLSDSTRLADKAKYFGVKVVLKIWDKMWHVWHAWNMPESKMAIDEISAFIKDNEN